MNKLHQQIRKVQVNLLDRTRRRRLGNSGRVRQIKTPVKLVVATAPNPTKLGRLTVKPLDGNDPAIP